MAEEKVTFTSTPVKVSCQLPPLRSLDDFLTESARFQLPRFGNRLRWQNRVYNNLIYYQTNYFLTFLLLFLVYCFFHPVEIIIGVFSLSACYICSQVTDPGILKIIAKLIGLYVFVLTLKSMIILATGVLLSATAVYLHSSLRMRNLQNKLVNTAEQAGLVTTPMGLFLKFIQLDRKC